MERIGLIYSFKTQKTARVADKIAKVLGEELVERQDAEKIDEERFMQFDRMILGVPTWFDGELPYYWDEFVPALEDLDLKGKKIALYGLGDEKGYAENFCDAIGLLAETLEESGATLVGFTSIEGFVYENSLAERGGHFVGLTLDFENKAAQINEQVTKWVEQLKKVF